MSIDQEAKRREAEHRRAVAEANAEAARQVLENPMLAKAFAELAAAYTLVWKASDPEDRDQREDAWVMIRALEQLQGHLRAKLVGGKVAAFNLRGAGSAIAAKSRND